MTQGTLTFVSPQQNLLKAKIEEAVEFDPFDVSHRAAYIEFRRTGKWTVKFKTVWPKSIYLTVQERLADYACALDYPTLK